MSTDHLAAAEVSTAREFLTACARSAADWTEATDAAYAALTDDQVRELLPRHWPGGWPDFRAYFHADITEKLLDMCAAAIAADDTNTTTDLVAVLAGRGHRI